MEVRTESAALNRGIEAGVRPVLVAGKWTPSDATATFVATNPETTEPFGDVFPISEWPEIEAALASAAAAARVIRNDARSSLLIAKFLEDYATSIQARSEELATCAAAETGLSATARYASIELPRTIRQLRLAADAARDGSWMRPTIDTQNNIRSCFAPVGPVFVIGPNNFPFAFNAISGGDFAAAIAAGNPVIAKGHPLHPNTTRILAELAHVSATAAGLPPGMVQLLFHVSPEDGIRLIEDARLKAIAFTGSRHAGLRIKSATDRAGKPFFGEMSSLNPVIVLPGAVAESSDDIADQFSSSMLAGTGQFCTKPGLLVLIEGASTDSLVEKIRSRIDAAPAGTLFSESSRSTLLAAIGTLKRAGADCLAGGVPSEKRGFRVSNTLLKVDGDTFLRRTEDFQTEAFGNASLIVTVPDEKTLTALIESLEGNLTGSIYSAKSGSDDSTYERIAPSLRIRVGRLLNDKMPTGVAVSTAMNHGGPFPASSQAHFTSVGIPGSIARFTQLECFDNVRPYRLPPCLRDERPTGTMWRSIDGTWTQTA